MSILSIQNLSVQYFRGKKNIPALRNVSLEINEGETIALVGESGCGKSTLALSIMGLIFPDEGKIISGKVIYRGNDLLKYSQPKWQSLRCKEISIVFQDPFSSLNPVLTIKDQICEAISTHQPDLTSSQVIEIAENSINEVMLKDYKRILESYPHQLSGGQRQRISLAIAIANRPKILIADEPTTALDVTIQRDILDLLEKLKNELSLTLILITHNLPLASQRSQRIAVMYAGKIVEIGPRHNIFKESLHPYTQGLIKSVPKLNSPSTLGTYLTGQPPDLTSLPNGCEFWPRCSKVMDKCKSGEPSEHTLNNSNVRCNLYKSHQG